MRRPRPRTPLAPCLPQWQWHDHDVLLSPAGPAAPLPSPALPALLTKPHPTPPHLETPPPFTPPPSPSTPCLPPCLPSQWQKAIRLLELMWQCGGELCPDIVSYNTVIKARGQGAFVCVAGFAGFACFVCARARVFACACVRVCVCALGKGACACTASHEATCARKPCT